MEEMTLRVPVAVKAKSNPDVAYVTSFSGYLTHRLTGEFKDNIANYFGQWPVDYKSWAWSEDAAVMDKFNIPRHMLFDVQMPGTVLGHITPQAALATHFPAGLPVVCTTSDKPVEALGAGLLALSTTSNAALAQKYLHIAASPEVMVPLSAFHAASYSMFFMEFSLIAMWANFS